MPRASDGSPCAASRSRRITGRMRPYGSPSNFRSGSNMASLKSLIDAFDVNQTNRALLVAVLRANARADQGCGRLIKSGSNLVFIPYEGNVHIINGNEEEMPDAGVSCAVSGLTAFNTYYLYTYMNAGVMAMEALLAGSNGHSTQAGIGAEIKTGDPTRSLVGMVQTIEGPAFSDSGQRRLVSSWFNRRNIGSRGAFEEERTTASCTIGQVNAETVTEFLCWADETVMASLVNTVSIGTANQTVVCSIGLDGANEQIAGAAQSATANVLSHVGSSRIFAGLTEGYHYVTITGRTTGGATGTFYASGSSLSVLRRG